MDNTIKIMIRSLVLSVLSGISAQTFFETLVQGRKLRWKWMEHVAVLAYAAGYMVIAVTEIPPYIFQPIRLIAVIAVVSQVFFRISVVKNLVLSVMYSGIYWIISILFFAVVSVTPVLENKTAISLMEPILEVLFLCLIMIFRYWYRRWNHGATDIKWGKFGLLSLVGIVVSVAIGLMSPGGSAGDYYARLTAIAGFAVAYVFCFYFMAGVLEKEAQVQRLQLLQERTQNQMNLYHGMRERYEQQRRFQHDYKNHLTCIQGMLENGQTQETLDYLAGLTRNWKQDEMSVNTNHSVVNVMLNRKYQEACDKGIVMTMAANDLSGLTISEEDIVTLLGNLLDNAIEACEKLKQDRVIRFKMVLEEGQLILSIRNPVNEPVKIRDNRIVTGKRDKSRHGIGLLNVHSVVRRNHGTSVIRCEDGWFSFSVMIPGEQ